MKILLYLFFLLPVMGSCSMKQDKNADVETCIPDTTKATAIFWIDKTEFKNSPEYAFRTVKAKVFIQEDGKVRLDSFIKKQTPRIETYVRHHLAKFQVTKKMLESGWVKPGEQVVQLRCLAAFVRDKGE